MATKPCEPVTGGPASACDSVCLGEPKWAALVDDKIVPMPQQRVPGRLLKSQAGIAQDRVLVRDHNSPDDVVIQDNDNVDLGLGNVFYTLNACDVTPRAGCRSPAKLAFFVDDRPELTTRMDQTGQSLRDLFSLPANCNLVRDYVGGGDRVIAVAAQVLFTDGPVLYTRAVVALLQITVNSRVFTEADGVRRQMLGRSIAALVYPDNPGQTTVWFVSDGNREVGLDQEITIRGCEVFDVVRKNVDGGFEADRVERELLSLRSSGQEVTLVAKPAAVIYRALRTKPGSPVAATDVLVPIPGAYPGQMLDWAYLPEGSPLIGKLKGNLQEHRINVDGKVWCQISYHPHGNGGGGSWNAAKHGFHTYLGELLSWLYVWN